MASNLSAVVKALSPQRGSARATMIPDNTSLRVFKISELARIIASHLIPISRGSAANLARTCRCLEEPVLSALWEVQVSLPILLKVLPEANWRIDGATGNYIVCALDLPMEGLNTQVYGYQFGLVVDPSSEAWGRIQRYASWMRQARLDQWWGLGEETLRILRLNAPASGWFPALQNLDWFITKSNLPFADLFFSPHLKKVSVYPSLSWDHSGIPPDVRPAIASTISALPASTLQSLIIFPSSSWSHMTPWADFTNSLSSVVLRCGPSFTEFISMIPLSGAAVDHLIRLPHLTTCHIDGPPPSSSPSDPLVFPPLTKLALRAGSVREWVPLLERLGSCVVPSSKVKGSLKSLRLPSPIIDATSASIIQTFRNLVDLKVDRSCYGRGGESQCIFKLNNDDVTKLVMTLSQLDSLLLGRPCSNNTCATTVACLLPISVHCVGLRTLAIHFNTTNIVDDLRNISDVPRFQELYSRPRCKLSCLDVYGMPLTLDDPGFETVVNGMIDIFPALGYCQEAVRGTGWRELSERLRKPQDGVNAPDTVGECCLIFPLRLLHSRIAGEPVKRE